LTELTKRELQKIGVLFAEIQLHAIEKDDLTNKLLRLIEDQRESYNGFTAQVDKIKTEITRSEARISSCQYRIKERKFD